MEIICFDHHYLKNRIKSASDLSLTIGLDPKPLIGNFSESIYDHLFLFSYFQVLCG